MYRHILVPLDGSPSAERALPVASTIARLSRGDLLLAHVHEPVAPIGSRFTPGELTVVDEGWDSQRCRQEQEYLDARVRELAEKTGLLGASTILDGPIPNALLDYALQAKIDLVVMAPRGCTSTYARRSFTSTGSTGTRTGSICGRALVRTHVC